MILVDVFVPAIDTTYNFMLDEEVPIQAVVEELIEMVERKERTSFAGNRSRVQLIDRMTQRILPKENTLLECAVATGCTLLLI